MRVRLLISRDLIRWHLAGDVIEVDEDEARRLIAANQAEPVERSAGRLEAAVMRQPEARQV